MSGQAETAISRPLLARNTGSGETAKKRGTFAPALTYCACIILLHISIGTLIWMHLLGPRAAVGDAFYFAAVTFLTIGYGDITPASHTAKVFFIIYTIASLIVQLTVVSQVLSKTLDWRPDEVQTNECDSQRVALRTFFRVRPRIVRAVQGLGLLIVIILAGAALLHVLANSRGQNILWIDCLYWSVTTLSTVGYGDIVPHEDKPLFACFFLAACVIFAFILGETVALLQEVGRHQRLEAFFHDGLSRPVLDAMDVLNDGRVSKVEFMMFIIEHLGLVERAELDRILGMFEAADLVGDGVLTIADVHAHRSRAARADGGADDPPVAAHPDPMAPGQLSIATTRGAPDNGTEAIAVEACADDRGAQGGAHGDGLLSPRQERDAGGAVAAVT